MRSTRCFPRRQWAFVAAAVLAAAGCEGLHEAGVPGMQRFVDTETPLREEEEHRTRYQTERDPASLRWLMANRLQSGMTLQKVEHVLGETGTRERNDLWIKTNGGHYRSGDTVFHWGPDREGKRVYLVFRDNALVNFDPLDFRD